MVAMTQDIDDDLVCHLALQFRRESNEVKQAWQAVEKNVRTILRRQHVNSLHPTAERPVCIFIGEAELMKVLGTRDLKIALLTLARLYDAGHIARWQAVKASRQGKPHNAYFIQKREVNVRHLVHDLSRQCKAVDDMIQLKLSGNERAPLRAVLKPMPNLSFNNLPKLESLGDALPGETGESREYAGIGGGGGSDVISASIIGHLLRNTKKKEMELLVSTRTWATGSQGKAGSKIGVKREIHNADDGPAPGTYRINKDTWAEGRDLEAIPVDKHQQVYMVLDQSESASDVPKEQQADLQDQFFQVLAKGKTRRIDSLIIADAGVLRKTPNDNESILSTSPTKEEFPITNGDIPRPKHAIDTVVTVDTGGDVFGADTGRPNSANTNHTTPDQDFRVQKAISKLAKDHNLVTAVLAPGVDAPQDAPQKALNAGGKRYTPNDEEKGLILKVLKDYQMDGSNPNRFGKTTLALQARLRGAIGWTSLDLPEYVVDTWENPWSSFVYIRECMSDIIFMPTTRFVEQQEQQNAKLSAADASASDTPKQETHANI